MRESGTVQGMSHAWRDEMSVKAKRVVTISVAHPPRQFASMGANRIVRIQQASTSAVDRLSCSESSAESNQSAHSWRVATGVDVGGLDVCLQG